MAILEMKVPSPGESITEVQIAHWLKKDGDYVEKDDELCEIDSDKATLTLNAEASGVIKLLVKEGETIPVGTVVCSIDQSAVGSGSGQPGIGKQEQRIKNQDMIPAPSAKADNNESTKKNYVSGLPSVAAEKMMKEKGIVTSDIKATGKDGRITKGDVMNISAGSAKDLTPNPSAKERGMAPSEKGMVSKADRPGERREKMSMLRKKVAERLVAVKQQTAMLTTFNEVDMSAILNIRKQYKESFKEKHGVSLGFMSFFTKAVCESLKNFPTVNARIDGDEIVYNDMCDIGIAVSAPKGLMVPVIRNAETLSFAQLEQQVTGLAMKARDGKISIDEMTGGTFTITNGGVFGSMLSTPIINPPQSAILGMHNIVERPVALNGEVVIRPIMYVALSYDHRIIDGRESVGFLVSVKKILEDPMKMLFEEGDPVKHLLGI